MRYAAFLRGINVGGHNRLPMADLRASLTEVGFGDVSTYIQSGNVILSSTGSEEEVATTIASAILARHGLDVPVVVRSGDELSAILSRHPDLESEVDPKFLHVMLADGDLSQLQGPPLDPAKFAPDRWTISGREIFVTYPSGSGRSKLGIDVFERSYGATLTARNINTIRKVASNA